MLFKTCPIIIVFTSIAIWKRLVIYYYDVYNLSIKLAILGVNIFFSDSRNENKAIDVCEESGIISKYTNTIYISIQGNYIVIL